MMSQKTCALCGAPAGHEERLGPDVHTFSCSSICGKYVLTDELHRVIGNGELEESTLRGLSKWASGTSLPKLSIWHAEDGFTPYVHALVPSSPAGPTPSAAGLLWAFFGPQACECGQPFMRDQTPIWVNEQGRLAVKCVHCGRAFSMSIVLEG